MRKLRWLLFIPLGIVESILLVLYAFFTLIWMVGTSSHIIAKEIYYLADKLPGLDWYANKK